MPAPLSDLRKKAATGFGERNFLTNVSSSSNAKNVFNPFNVRLCVHYLLQQESSHKSVEMIGNFNNKERRKTNHGPAVPKSEAARALEKISSAFLFFIV